MLKCKTVLKNEVIRYFQEHSIGYLTTISNEMKAILKEYKQEEKIETIDKLIASYELDVNNLKTSFAELDELCAKESAVFIDASDYESARNIEAFKRHAKDLEFQLKDLVGKNPTNKNEIILVQAQKITLFDYLFKLEPTDYNLPEYCYFLDAEVDTQLETCYVFQPLLDLNNYFKFN